MMHSQKNIKLQQLRFNWYRFIS